MEIKIKKGSELKTAGDILILPLFEKSGHDIYNELDSKIGGLVERVFRSKEFTGSHMQVSRLILGGGIGAKSILLLGLGKSSEVTRERLRQAGGKAFNYADDVNAKSIVISTNILKELTSHKEFRRSENPPEYYLLEGGMLSRYTFERFKSNPDDEKGIENVVILSQNTIRLDKLNIIASVSALAKDMINTPSNNMTPSIIANTAKDLYDHPAVNVRILERADVEREGMGAYVAVAKGSNEPLKFIVIEYKGKDIRPVALVGKTITFDSGGICLKPAQNMEQMKYDMSGGACVLAVIKAAASLDMPINLVGILPATENMSGGSATRPGDVVTTISKKTVEIINTDAEGRLILADGIGYAIKYYNPDFIIDIATLTGACSIALGHEAIAMMGNDTALKTLLTKAAEETFERVWEMPLFPELKDYLKSDVADMKNVSNREGSLITAGFFLSEFAGKTPWVHLDIAGTAWSSRDKSYIKKGATAVGVRLLIETLSLYSKTV